MRKWNAWPAAMILFAAAASAAAQEPAAKPCSGDTYGTAVEWLRETSLAARQAKADGRLVMVLHLSGELDDPEKT